MRKTGSIFAKSRESSLAHNNKHATGNRIITYPLVTVSFTCGWNRTFVNSRTHLGLVPRLRISGSVPLFFIGWCLIKCRTNSTFTLQYISRGCHVNVSYIPENSLNKICIFWNSSTKSNLRIQHLLAPKSFHPISLHGSNDAQTRD